MPLVGLFLASSVIGAASKLVVARHAAANLHRKADLHMGENARRLPAHPGSILCKLLFATVAECLATPSEDGGSRSTGIYRPQRKPVSAASIGPCSAPQFVARSVSIKPNHRDGAGSAVALNFKTRRFQGGQPGLVALVTGI